jgi:hypothetical protein
MTECTHLDQVKNVKPHTHGLLREGCHSPKFCPAVKAFSVLTRLGELITSGLLVTRAEPKTAIPIV